MKERPILFSAPMVRALLAGTKTQTRRAVKLPHQNPLGQWEPTTVGGKGDLDKAKTRPAPEMVAIWHTRTGDCICCPYGAPGDRLWVRETWREDSPDDPERAIYRADEPSSLPPGFKWKPSIFMPRWASRITLEVKAVRVERLQEISEEDAIAEGCVAEPHGTWWQGYRDCGGTIGLLHQMEKGEQPPDWMIEPHKEIPRPWLDRLAKTQYELLWNQINGPGSWEANPFVWCIEFERINHA